MYTKKHATKLDYQVPQLYSNSSSFTGHMRQAYIWIRIAQRFHQLGQSSRPRIIHTYKWTNEEWWSSSCSFSNSLECTAEWDGYGVLIVIFSLVDSNHRCDWYNCIVVAWLRVHNSDFNAWDNNHKLYNLVYFKAGNTDGWTDKRKGD